MGHVAPLQISFWHVQYFSFCSAYQSRRRRAGQLPSQAKKNAPNQMKKPNLDPCELRPFKGYFYTYSDNKVTQMQAAVSRRCPRLECSSGSK